MSLLLCGVDSCLSVPFSSAFTDVCDRKFSFSTYQFETFGRVSTAEPQQKSQPDLRLSETSEDLPAPWTLLFSQPLNQVSVFLRLLSLSVSVKTVNGDCSINLGGCGRVRSCWARCFSRPYYEPRLAIKPQCTGAQDCNLLAGWQQCLNESIKNV